MDARLRIFVGGVFDCRCRNRPILAAFAGDEGGVRIEDSKIEDSKIEGSKIELARYFARNAKGFAEDSALSRPLFRTKPGSGDCRSFLYASKVAGKRRGTADTLTTSFLNTGHPCANSQLTDVPAGPLNERWSAFGEFAVTASHDALLR